MAEVKLGDDPKGAASRVSRQGGAAATAAEQGRVRSEGRRNIDLQPAGCLILPISGSARALWGQVKKNYAFGYSCNRTEMCTINLKNYFSATIISPETLVRR